MSRTASPLLLIALLVGACGSEPALAPGQTVTDIALGANADAPEFDVPEGTDSGTPDDPDASANPDAPITLTDVAIVPDAGGEDAITIPGPDAEPGDDTPPEPDVGVDTAPEDTGPLPDTGPGSLGTCCDGSCETRCDLDTQECCIAIGGGGETSCVAAGACESGVVAECDGPEDCPGRAVCCIQGAFDLRSRSADVRATCEASCDYAFDLMGGSVTTSACHDAGDCGGDQTCCSEESIPAGLCLDGLASRGVELAGGSCE